MMAAAPAAAEGAAPAPPAPPPSTAEAPPAPARVFPAPLLEPFSHQVAGHTALCKFNDRTICKPLIPNERDFYEREARTGPLAPFTADYLGVVNVTMTLSPRKGPYTVMAAAAAAAASNADEAPSSASPAVDAVVPTGLSSPALMGVAMDVDAAAAAAVDDEDPVDGDGDGDGVVVSVAGVDAELVEEYALTLQPPASAAPALDDSGAHRSPLPAVRRLRADSDLSSFSSSSSSSGAASPVAAPVADDSDRAARRRAALLQDAPRSGRLVERSRPRRATHRTPWSVHSHSNERRREQAGRRVNQFVLLEDLTYRFRRPCILDLKMGTRQHGPNATPEKAARQTAKCLATTSASLGVRVCGMQVYRPESDTFTYRDKYYGRSLTPATFKDSIREFLSDGKVALTNFIPAFIGRLSKLYQVIQSLPHLRFYGSSLLLIYDGHHDGDYMRAVDVRMIDFANTCRVQQPPAPDGTTWLEADVGYLKGLRSLISVLEEILQTEGVPAAGQETGRA